MFGQRNSNESVPRAQDGVILLGVALITIVLESFSFSTPSGKVSTGKT